MGRSGSARRARAWGFRYGPAPSVSGKSPLGRGEVSADLGRDLVRAEQRLGSVAAAAGLPRGGERDGGAERDERPLEENCPCLACRHSRAYLRHLFMADEMLGPILLTHHNLTYYQRLLTGARQAIEGDRFVSYFDEKLRGWHDEASPASGGRPMGNSDVSD